jgi:hypothetical protein
MNFGDEEETQEKDALLFQTIDKMVWKLTLKDGEVSSMFEMPSLCSQLQACHISGKECLIGLN